MSRADDTPTPPVRRSRQTCRDCGFHRDSNPNHDIRCPTQRPLQAHANWYWVRAIFVATAEKMQRGPAEVGFTYFSGAPEDDEPTERGRK
jgi:hypothetical protein